MNELRGIEAWYPNKEDTDNFWGSYPCPNILHGPKTQLESLLHDEDAEIRVGAFMELSVHTMQAGYNAIINQMNQDLFNGNY